MVALFLDDNKTIDDGDGRRTATKQKVFIDAILYIFFPSLHPCDVKLEHNTNVVFFLL